MDAKFVEVARKSNISQEEWKELIGYVGNDVALALATRMFYTLNIKSTHPFDFYVPRYKEVYDKQSTIQEYLRRARKFVSILSSNSASEDVWYLAAQLLGACSLYEKL